ncbi:hypothetical protein RBA41_06930 [Massilia sp. CCM 9210]|uniref:hypothetical protein n=1 Tax=Massilia scottii TaxID=3057166 RepID=UPI002796E02A|nr:hypothetical protein [Massilia sp. CCM 9210]MDQ1813036.1 hypothetical protein [Massilia sp. CCM 9210]
MQSSPSRHLLATVAAAIVLLGSGGAFAAGFTARAVPMLLHPYDDKFIPTAACMDVAERRYDDPDWVGKAAWPGADAAEKSLISVVAALRAGERDRVLALSDPEHGRDPAQFDTQYTAFVQQLKFFRLSGVQYAYRLGTVTVFFMRIELAGKAGVRWASPFAFDTHPDGSVWFLPYRPTDLGFMLLQDWFNSEFGPTGRQSPQYCDTKGASGARFRLPLDGPLREKAIAAAPGPGPSPALTFFGRQVGAGAPTPVVQLFEKIAAAAGRNDFSTIVAATTAHGASQLNDIRSAEERKHFLADLAKRRPAFLVDLGDAAVLYTRGSDVEPMYFARYGTEWKWVNIFVLNINSRVFGQEIMLKQAAAPQPFSALRQR